MEMEKLMKLFAQNIELNSFYFFMKILQDHDFMQAVETIEAYEFQENYVILDVLTKHWKIPLILYY